MALISKVTKKIVYRNDENYLDTKDCFVELDCAYKKITHISGNKSSINITVTTYNNESKQEVVSKNSYTFTPSVADGSENFIRQGYEYLKTLPEFAGAADC